MNINTNDLISVAEASNTVSRGWAIGVGPDPVRNPHVATLSRLPECRELLCRTRRITDRSTQRRLSDIGPVLHAAVEDALPTCPGSRAYLHRIAGMPSASIHAVAYSPVCSRPGTSNGAQLVMRIASLS